MHLPAELRILQDKVHRVQVQLHQSIIHGSLIPVVGDSFPSLLVGEVALFSVDGEKALDNILGCTNR